ncbi:beta strand repeat-containing protein, partial [Bordetella pseudohinzii]
MTGWLQVHRFRLGSIASVLACFCGVSPAPAQTVSMYNRPCPESPGTNLISGNSPARNTTYCLAGQRMAQSVFLGTATSMAGDSTIDVFDGVTAIGGGALVNANGTVRYVTVVGAGAVGGNGTGTATAPVFGASAFGARARAFANASTALGYNTTANGTGATAIGANATTGADYALAIGVNSQANGANSVALGLTSRTGGNNAVAIGHSANAAQVAAVAIGNATAATQARSVAIGANSSVDGVASAVLGNANAVNAANAGVFGNNNTLSATATTSRVIGSNNNIAVSDAFVLGNSAQVNVEGGVAIGSGSVAATAAGVAGYAPQSVSAGDAARITATQSTQSAVSVGDASTAKFRQINGLAAGTADSDAVNVSQLRAVETVANSGWNVTAQGANATNVAPGDTVDFASADSNLAITKGATDNKLRFTLSRNLDVDAVTLGTTQLQASGLTLTGGPSITTAGIDGGGLKLSNIAAGTATTDAVNVGQLQAVSSVANSGWNVTAQGANASNVAPGATVDFSSPDSNLAITKGATDSKLRFALSRNLDVDAVTLGTTQLQASGLTLTGGPSITTAGIDGGGLKLSNIAAGTATTDAVNVGQLQAVSTVANSGWNVTAQGANASNVAPGATVDFASADSNLAITKGATDSKLRFALSRNLNVDAVTLGTTQLQASGLTLTGGPSITTAGIDGGGLKLSNIAAGSATTDAVNVGQLQAVSSVANSGWNVTAQGANASNVAPGATVDFASADSNLAITKGATDNKLRFALSRNLNVDAVTLGTTQLQASGLTLTGGPSITTAGIDGGGLKLGNIAAGTATTDAVNVGQLQAVSSVANSGWNVTAQGANASNVAPGATVDFSSPDSNLAITKGATDNKLRFALSRNLDVDTVTLGTTQLQASGLTLTGGPSITTAGIDGGGLKLSNIAAGTATTDAVNVGQLQAVSTVANSGWNVTAQGSNASNVAPGATVDFASADSNLAITKGATDNKLRFALSRNLNVDAVTLGTTQLQASGLTLTGGPSITTAGIDGGGLKLSNIAAGSATTDAVNVGQLQAVSSVANSGWNVTAQGANSSNVAPGATVDFSSADSNLAITKGATDSKLRFALSRNLDVDAVTLGTTQLQASGLTLTGGPSITTAGIDGGGLKLSNIAAGTATTDAVNVGQLQAVSTVANSGWNVTAQGANATNVAPGATVDFASADSNLAITKGATDSKLRFALSRNLNVDAVTLGTTQLQASGLTLTGGPSITTAGIDGGGLKLSNIAAGTATTDAVNVGQLQAVSTVANSGWNVTAQGANATNVAPGATVDFSSADSNLAITKGATDNKLRFALSRNLNVDAVTLGTTQLQASGLTLTGGPSITTAGIDGGGLKLSNIAAGTATTDAVNVGQLQAVSTVANSGWNVTAQGANASNVAPGATVDFSSADSNLAITKGATDSKLRFALSRNLNVDAVTLGTTQLQASGLTLTGGPSITTAGIDGGGLKLSNIAAGSATTDAVNVGQLQAVSSVANSGWNVTAQGANASNVAPGATVDFSSPDSNLAITKGATDNKLRFALSRNLDVDAVTLGTTQLQASGLTLTGGPSITTAGIDGGGLKLSNIAAGSATTDAVNVGQLQAVSTVANSGWNVTAQGANASNVAPGATVDFSSADSNLAISKGATDSKLRFALSRNLNVDAVTLG